MYSGFEIFKFSFSNKMFTWSVFIASCFASNPLKSSATFLSGVRLGSFVSPIEFSEKFNVSRVLLNRPDLFTDIIGTDAVSAIQAELMLGFRSEAVDYVRSHNLPEIKKCLMEITSSTNDIVLAALIASPISSADSINLRLLINLVNDYLASLREPCLFDQLPGYLQNPEHYDLIYTKVHSGAYRVLRHPEEGIVALIHGQRVPASSVYANHKADDFVAISVMNRASERFSYMRVFDLRTGRGIQTKPAKREITKVPNYAAVAVREWGTDVIHIVGWKGYLGDGLSESCVPDMSDWLYIIYAETADFILHVSNPDWHHLSFQVDATMKIDDAVRSISTIDFPFTLSESFSRLSFSNIFSGYVQQYTSGFLSEDNWEDDEFAVFTPEADAVLIDVLGDASTFQRVEPRSERDMLCSQISSGKYIKAWRAIRRLGVPDIYNVSAIRDACRQ